MTHIDRGVTVAALETIREAAGTWLKLHTCEQCGSLDVDRTVHYGSEEEQRLPSFVRVLVDGQWHYAVTADITCRTCGHVKHDYEPPRRALELSPGGPFAIGEKRTRSRRR